MADAGPPLDVETVARTLLECEAQRVETEPLTARWPDLNLETAYAIQDQALEMRLARGETLIGVKLGLTSRAKQRQMGVDAPITAWLTDAMVVPAYLRLPNERLIHPRIEPEIAFVMRERLAGPGVTSARALAAVDAVHGALEVIDSRYREFRFGLPDVVADNGSSASFVIGACARSPRDLDLMFEACLLSINGRILHTATAAAILGDPAQALAFAANELARRGRVIEAGWIVLAGALTEAVTLQEDAVIRAAYSGCGTVSLQYGSAREPCARPHGV